MHIVAQVYRRGLGVKVETNCLRASDLIPRHSFLSTSFSIFINEVLKCCVCVCVVFVCACVRVVWWLIKQTLVLNCLNAEQVNSESDDSGDALAERYISFKPKPIAISVLLCKLRSFNNS